METLTNKNILEEKFELIKLYGTFALLTRKRIADSAIPPGWYRFELKTLKNALYGEPTRIVKKANANFYGSVLIPKQVRFKPNQKKRNFGNVHHPKLYGLQRSYTEFICIDKFCKMRGIELRPYYLDSIL